MSRALPLKAMRSALSLLGLAMASAFTAPSGPFTAPSGPCLVRSISLSLVRTSLTMTEQSKITGLDTAIAAKGEDVKQDQEFEPASSSTLDVSAVAAKVRKEWIGKRYVTPATIRTRRDEPGAKFPANILVNAESWAAPVPSIRHDELVAARAAEAKQTATVLAMCLLLLQPLATSAHYQMVGGSVTKVESVGAIRESVTDTWNKVYHPVYPMPAAKK